MLVRLVTRSLIGIVVQKEYVHMSNSSHMALMVDKSAWRTLRSRTRLDTAIQNFMSLRGCRRIHSALTVHFLMRGLYRMLGVIQRHALSKQQLGQLVHHLAFKVFDVVHDDVLGIETLDRIALNTDAHKLDV